MTARCWNDWVYGVEFCILCGPALDAQRWLSRKVGYEVADIDPRGDARARTLTTGGGTLFVLWLPEFRSTPAMLGVLAHECFHLADLVLRARGLQLAPSSAEAYAYYIGWLMTESLTRLRRRT